MSFFTQVSIEDEPKKQQTTKTGSSKIEPRGDSKLANELLDMLDKWHKHKEMWDDQLDAEIFLMEYEIRTTNKLRLNWGKKGTKYFSPSSSNSDKRELFHKIKGEKRDQEEGKAWQGRWRRMGEAMGASLQRDLLFIAKHFEKEFGYKPPFIPLMIEHNGKKYPAWEKFMQRIIKVEHRGFLLHIMGQCDGILVDTRTGELILLEIKSKQTTAAQTGFYSMKEAKLDHEKQTKLYSKLYEELGIKRAIVLYGNLSKKGWNMDEEEYAKNPDLRAFTIDITDEDVEEILDYLADVMQHVERDEAPPMDLGKFTFNNFKEACVASMTDEEYEHLEQQVQRISRSRIPAWKKKGYLEAWDYIKEAKSK